MLSEELQAFKSTYIVECLDLLADMEERLLGLDERHASREDLDAIFRCAHSIKGGAGAFGLTHITQFTHILEALLDHMREGKLETSRGIIDTLLRARDVVMHMVICTRDDTELEADYGHELAQELSDIANGVGDVAIRPPAAADLEADSAPQHMAMYHIHFKPHPEMMLHGSDPLLLLRELKRIGSCTITAHIDTLPDFLQMDAEQCYIYWDVTISTQAPVSELHEVFEFVEGECDLTIHMQDSAPADTAVAEREPAAAPAVAPPSPTSEKAVQSTSIRVDIDKVDRLINMVGEIVITQAMLVMQTQHLDPSEPNTNELLRGIDELNNHTRELQEAVMAVRMQPVKSIFSRMPRLVRDLSSKLNKQIKLHMVGEHTEVDKTIIEQLADPLTHMLRNSIDHGIEMPDVRLKNGKPAEGTVTLLAMHRGGRIVIEISDDGNGINREKVLQIARERGVVSENAQPSDQEIDQLIFSAGFSTADAVTDISGRGVGMDVVKRNIEGIGGNVVVINTPQKGARFVVSLPLTLAILDGMIVRIAKEYYIIPIANIVETLRPQAEDIRNVTPKQTVINIRGSFVPMVYLHQIFNITGAAAHAHEGLVVLVEHDQERLGIVVDELIGQQQVVIKSLEDNTHPIAGISGATILGDGKVSLIIDIAGLHRSNLPTHPTHVHSTHVPSAPVAA